MQNIPLTEFHAVEFAQRVFGTADGLLPNLNHPGAGVFSLELGDLRATIRKAPGLNQIMAHISSPVGCGAKLYYDAETYVLKRRDGCDRCPFPAGGCKLAAQSG